MKKLIGLYVLLLTVLSNAMGQNKEVFPLKITTHKTAKHERVKSTKLFLQILDGYEYITGLLRYQKNEKLYIQVVDNQSSFIEFSQNFTKEAIEKEGAKVDVFQRLKINKFDAIYSEGPSKYEGETKIGLTFGDETFVVIIMGVCKTNDSAGKEELKTILKSAYYAKELEVSETELINFELDLSITKFKYAGKMGNMYAYNSTGKAEGEDNENIMMLAPMPSMSENKAEAYIQDLVWRYERDALLYEKSINKENFNGYSSFVLRSKASKGGDEFNIYHAILLGETSSVVFVAMGKGEDKNFVEQIKMTVKSLKIKD